MIDARAALWGALVLGAGAACWLATDGRIDSADARAACAGGTALVVALAAYGLIARPGRVAAAVSDGLLAFAEEDYSLRVAADDGDPWELARRFNQLGDRLRRGHDDLYQRQMLLETVLAATPTAVVLENDGGRVVYANGTARELLGDGARLEGRNFTELVSELAPEVAEALSRPTDALFSVEDEGRDEVYDVARRYFDLEGCRHRLTMIRPLGRELERRDAEAWKRAIRVIGHELNNSLAPISSLAHSARALADGPRAGRLRAVLDTIEERTRHLTAFLDGFARLARLPKPGPEEVAWQPFLAGVQAVHPFRVVGEPPAAPGWFDRAQLQQVLINLVKNAHEAGSAGDDVEVRVTPDDGGVRVEVLDRGAGMTEEVRRSATLPFYSTKKAGGGIGLALAREIVDAHGGHLGLAARDGGGTVVELWLPGREASA